MRTNAKLADLNIEWLRQALLLVEQVEDTNFTTSPAGMAPHKVGGHLRHVLEFYECFLDGLERGTVDYDARRRCESLERRRSLAKAAIVSIISRLELVRHRPMDADLSVHMEDAEAGVLLASSVGRELQALSSHTIHHFALIAMVLRLHGVATEPNFGVAPSTLRHQAALQQRVSRNPEEA